MTTTMSPADIMRALNIVQEGDLILTQVADRFDLPADAEEARGLVAQLVSSLDRVARVHNFTKGMGLAAPQIGELRPAAVVQKRDGYYFTLLNPRIIDTSPETDEQFEGCLSFFNVRGKVCRPLRIKVEHQTTDGAYVKTTFERGIARLVCHEIDHLEGRLYTARMKPGVNLIHVSEYYGSGRR